MGLSFAVATVDEVDRPAPPSGTRRFIAAYQPRRLADSVETNSRILGPTVDSWEVPGLDEATTQQRNPASKYGTLAITEAVQ